MRVLNFIERKSLAGSKFTWWSGNARFINFSGKFLGAHIVHLSLIMFWSGSITIFEISHLWLEQSLYEQGFILVQHITTLAFCINIKGNMDNIYVFFVISLLHFIGSGVLGLGGLYYCVFGPEKFEEILYYDPSPCAS